jgi:transcriptional regulator with XRE-family HTH domain
MDIKTQFGRRLRELRIRSGLSQGELASAARLDRGFVGLVERGERGIGIDAIERIARALDVAPRELLSATRARENPDLSEAEILGKRVAVLAKGADSPDLERFQVLAEAFFGSARPKRGARRPRRRAR